MCRFSSLPILNWAVPYKIEQPQQGMKLQEDKKSILESWLNRVQGWKKPLTLEVKMLSL